VCSALKKLTVMGECTVVCTIHQPQPKIFNLFDNLILMKRGKIVYQGSAKKTEVFLEQVGFPCPPDVNIADHLLDVISPANEKSDELDGAATKKIVPVNLSLGFEKPFYASDGARSWFDQFIILSRRNMQQYLRNKDIILMNAVVTVLVAVFIGCGLWYQIGTGQDSIAKRVPSLFFACITQGVIGSLQAINSFPSERAIMLRERQAGTYQVSSYFAAKTAVDMLSQLWPPILFSCIVYPLIGYQNRADKFFMYMFFMVLDCMAATSVATASKFSPLL
jgi:ATP-binding cassette subfamily G (WHITE) protein 2